MINVKIKCLKLKYILIFNSRNRIAFKYYLTRNWIVLFILNEYKFHNIPFIFQFISRYYVYLLRIYVYCFMVFTERFYYSLSYNVAKWIVSRGNVVNI